MKILNTTKITTEIEDLIDSSNEFLIFISPYVKINDKLKVKLSDTFNRIRKIYFAFRINENKPEEIKWLNNFKNIKLFAIKNLHAKIYINEKTAIITSMNLFEYSQINNHEIGVKILNNEDKKEYLDILKEIRIMIKSEYNENDIIELIDKFENYTMGKLFNEILKANNNLAKKNNQDLLYKQICDFAVKIVKFNDDELYQDKTAILRNTNLGKERYNTLFYTLIEKLR